MTLFESQPIDTIVVGFYLTVLVYDLFSNGTERKKRNVTAYIFPDYYEGRLMIMNEGLQDCQKTVTGCTVTQ